MYVGKGGSINVQRKNQFHLLHQRRKRYKMTVIEAKSGPLVRLFDFFIIFNLRKGKISYSVPKNLYIFQTHSICESYKF